MSEHALDISEDPVYLLEPDMSDIAESLIADTSKSLHQKIVMLIKSVRRFSPGECSCLDLQIGVTKIMMSFTNTHCKATCTAKSHFIPTRKEGKCDENELYKWFLVVCRDDSKTVADMCENWGCANQKALRRRGKGFSKLAICKECDKCDLYQVPWFRILHTHCHEPTSK